MNNWVNKKYIPTMNFSIEEKKKIMENVTKNFFTITVLVDVKPHRIIFGAKQKKISRKYIENHDAPIV